MENCFLNFFGILGLVKTKYSANAIKKYNVGHTIEKTMGLGENGALIIAIYFPLISPAIREEATPINSVNTTNTNARKKLFLLVFIIYLLFYY